jgi:hypothetical protein
MYRQLNHQRSVKWCLLFYVGVIVTVIDVGCNCNASVDNDHVTEIPSSDEKEQPPSHFPNRDSTRMMQHPPRASTKLSDTSYWCDDQHEDFVRGLPGYVPIRPPSCWYSGYVSYEVEGALIHTHYTLQTAEFLSDNVDSTAESSSIDNPYQKPLIYWSS